MSGKNCSECGAKIWEGAELSLCDRCVSKTIGVSLGRRKNDERDVAEAAGLEKAFPRFEIGEALGRGGMGRVYRVRHKGLDRTLALKVLAADRLSSVEAEERFRREARTLARLEHPNILPITDSGTSGGFRYLVLEYAEGGSLRDRLLKRGPREIRESLEVAQQVASALEYAHSKGVVHRDIKPENILFDGGGRIKVADFGLAQLVSDESGEDLLDEPETSLGSPRYMAPEQKGRPEVDARADVYALGLVLHEMLCGRLPSASDKVAHLRPTASPGVNRIVEKATRKAAEERYGSAKELREDLERELEKLGWRAPLSGFELDATMKGFRILTVVNLIAASACGVLTVLLYGSLFPRMSLTDRMSWQVPLFLALYPIFPLLTFWGSNGGKIASGGGRSATRLVISSLGPSALALTVTWAGVLGAALAFSGRGIAAWAIPAAVLTPTLAAGFGLYLLGRVEREHHVQRWKPSWPHVAAITGLAAWGLGIGLAGNRIEVGLVVQAAGILSYALAALMSPRLGSSGPDSVRGIVARGVVIAGFAVWGGVLSIVAGGVEPQFGLLYVTLLVAATPMAANIVLCRRPRVPGQGADLLRVEILPVWITLFVVIEYLAARLG